MGLIELAEALVLKKIVGELTFKGHGYFDPKYDWCKKVNPDYWNHTYTVFTVTDKFGTDHYGALLDYQKEPNMGDIVNMTLRRFSTFHKNKISTNKYIGHKKKVTWREILKIEKLEDKV